MTVAVSVMEASLATSGLTTVIVLIISVVVEVLLVTNVLSTTYLHRGLFGRGTDARGDAGAT